MWFDIETDEQRPTRRNVVIGEEGEKRRTNVLKVETSRLEVRKNFFNVRAASVWNNIPDKVREKKLSTGLRQRMISGREEHQRMYSRKNYHLRRMIGKQGQHL